MDWFPLGEKRAAGLSAVLGQGLGWAEAELSNPLKGP